MNRDNPNWVHATIAVILEREGWKLVKDEGGEGWVNVKREEAAAGRVYRHAWQAICCVLSDMESEIRALEVSVQALQKQSEYTD